MQSLGGAREGQSLRGFAKHLKLPDGDVHHDRCYVKCV
jgi:hypothetical protein